MYMCPIEITTSVSLLVTLTTTIILLFMVSLPSELLTFLEQDAVTFILNKFHGYSSCNTTKGAKRLSFQFSTRVKGKVVGRE